MSEIKTSQKCVDYAPPQTLKTKKRVYSQALLMKIPHDHAEESDISLKIGRYTLPYGRVESDQPKSELTLDNEEVTALIKYISDNYTPVNLGQGQYISVDRDNAELVRQFKALIDGQADTASLLIENGILSDNVYVAATSIKKIGALEEYEASLAQNYPESYWQDWFSGNKWLLGSDFAQIIDERRIDTENIGKAIFTPYDDRMEDTDTEKSSQTKNNTGKSHIKIPLLWSA